MNTNKTSNKKFTWKSVTNQTTEHCHVSNQSGETTYTGAITGLANGKVVLLNYEIKTDQASNEYSVLITSQKDDKSLIQIRRTAGKWYNADNEHLREFDRCSVFDISLTPLTNTFAINSLKLEIGESKTIHVVYINPLENKMIPVQQKYARVQEGECLYENIDTGFTAKLVVDSDGFVISYPNIWELVRPATGSAAMAFFSALISDERSIEIQETYDIYAPLLGSWEVMITDLMGDIKENKKIGEWHFSRILEGRAIQDILIAPARENRSGIKSLAGNRYGTILRTFDFKTLQWTMNWFNPVSGVHSVLTARTEPGKIIQESTETGGMVMRWVFDNMKEDTFHWYGEHSTDQCKTWTKTVEFYCIRMSGTSY